MKPKISPTSPKSQLPSEPNIDSFYKEHLQTIQTPPKKKLSYPLWLLIIVVIIAFFGGVVGQIVFTSYGSSIPWLDKLSFFSNTSPQNILSNSRNTAVSGDTVVARKTLAAVTASVVSIYATPSDSSDLSGVYSASALRGNGFILTDDGYILTTADIAAATGGLTVMTGTGQLYTVDSVVTDPSTRLSFLKIKATGLSSMGITTMDSINAADNIVVLKQFAYKKAPAMAIMQIAFVDYQLNEQNGLVSKSSDDSYHAVLLADGASSFFAGGVAFSAHGEAVGIMIQDSSRNIMPFAYVTEVTAQVLTNHSLSRPSLGIHYFDLAAMPGVSPSLSQGLSVGALVYSDNEAARPSINPQGPAQLTRLKKGDVITAVDGQTVDQQHLLEDMVREHKPQDTITLTVLRNSAEMTILVVLGTYNY
jgi:S1-C subfamily serine protease